MKKCCCLWLGDTHIPVNLFVLAANSGLLNLFTRFCTSGSVTRIEQRLAERRVTNRVRIGPARPPFAHDSTRATALRWHILQILQRVQREHPVECRGQWWA